MNRPLHDELIRRAGQLSRILAARGTVHAFIGGLAMNAWSIPAPTYDIDLCAELEPEEAPDLIRKLEAEGFVPPPTPWIESVGPARFQEFTVQWPFDLGLRPADIFLATDPFQKEALAGRKRVELETGFETDVAGPETVVGARHYQSTERPGTREACGSFEIRVAPCRRAVAKMSRSGMSGT